MNPKLRIMWPLAHFAFGICLLVVGVHMRGATETQNTSGTKGATPLLVGLAEQLWAVARLWRSVEESELRRWELVSASPLGF